MAEHKKDYEAMKPKKTPKPTKLSENTTQEKPKQTSRLKFSEFKLKLKLPKLRLSTPKTDSTPPATEEHTNNKAAPVKTQNLKQISNNMKERLNYITEKAGNAFNSTFSSKKRESNKGNSKG